MATRRASPPAARPGGPYVTTALLCERVLQEQDGVLSLIRVVDRVIQGAVGPGAPDEMPAVAVNLTAVIILKSGDARGRYAIRLTLEGPSGQRLPQEASLPILLEGEGDRGVNLVVNVGFQAEQEGLYWFDVTFEDPIAGEAASVLLTRVPLRIVYQPQRVGTASTEDAP